MSVPPRPGCTAAGSRDSPEREPMSDSRLVRRLPTILAEVVSVVFAVLVALAVDQWWEEREEARLAADTLEAVAREIRGNRSELVEKGDPGGAPGVLARVDSAIAAFREGRKPGNLAVTWDLALLSSAAWETAQLTGTIRRIPLDLAVDLAQLYEMQRYFGRTQDDLASTIGEIPPRIETEPVSVLLELRFRYANAASVRGTLSALYACTLVRLEGPEIPESADCPGGSGGDAPAP